jgi:hypothetical protein
MNGPFGTKPQASVFDSMQLDVRRCRCIERLNAHMNHLNPAFAGESREVKIVSFAGAYFSWLERLPGTQEAAGSSPVAPARISKSPFNAR